MTFRALAIRNVRGGWRRYAAFLLSSTAAVMIAYLFASFVAHPDVRSGHIIGGAAVAQGLLACVYLIAVFSFFFVLYSSSSFYKTRQKEFGLLQLLGMTPWQIRRLAFAEQMIVAACAIVCGLGLGILFSKLFYMGIGELLRTEAPVRFLIVGSAAAWTAVGFAALFAAVAAASLFGIGRKPVIELLRASRKPKRPPLASAWLTALAVVALGGGYILAYTTNLRSVILLMTPITGLVVLGTYFLFTQGCIAALGRLMRSRGYYWKGVRLLALSQLSYRLKDTARMMFSVAVLFAVVFTAIGAVYVFHQDIQDKLLVNTPFALSIEEQGLDTRKVVDPEALKALFAKHGIEPEIETRTPLVDVTATGEPEAALIGESSWNALAAELKLPTADVEPGRTMFAYPFERKSGEETSGQSVAFAVAGRTLTFVSDGTIYAAATNHGKRLWILDDADFEDALRLVPDAERTVLYAYDWSGWESDAAFVREALELVAPEIPRSLVRERITGYQDIRQFTSLTFFIGLFVGILFFFAAGSLLYFKQFTELEEDRQTYRQLLRIGVSPKELRSVIRVQIGSVFGIPFVVGAVHALFAYKMLGNVMQTNVWASALSVVAAFAALQLLYYVVTERAYMRQLGIAEAG
ncbi:ABC transporter permease [Paenibacillus sp.]|uniref:ABC transporter permease n=1 Tax=Paenibacillus sp. TaxID=58172 RepID=UPI00281286F1|nr:ABC transporter permease [Paenibacillus sp.]